MQQRPPFFTCHHLPIPSLPADDDIAAAARQVNADLLQQLQQQAAAQRGGEPGLAAPAATPAGGLDSEALLSAVR